MKKVIISIILALMLFGCLGDDDNSGIYGLLKNYDCFQYAGDISGLHNLDKTVKESDYVLIDKRINGPYEVFRLIEGKITCINYDYTLKNLDELEIKIKEVADLGKTDVLRSINLVDEINEVDLKMGEIEILEDDSHYFYDMIESNKLKIENDILYIPISYGGGYKLHTYKLYAEKSFIESNPVQLKLYLSHNGRGDNAEALYVKTLKFDLSEIKKMYKEIYNFEIGSVLLRLDQSDRIIEYNIYNLTEEEKLKLELKELMRDYRCFDYANQISGLHNLNETWEDEDYVVIDNRINGPYQVYRIIDNKINCVNNNNEILSLEEFENYLKDVRENTDFNVYRNINFVEDIEEKEEESNYIISAESLTIEGDILTFNSNIFGLYQFMDFRLYSENSFLESNPVQINLFLDFKGSGEMYKCIVKETIEFDLSKVKEKYKEAYQTEIGSIILIFNQNNSEEPIKSIQYDF